MSRSNDTPILVLALVITAAILGGGYWWFSDQFKTNPIEKLFPAQSPNPADSPTSTQLPSPNLPTAFPLPTNVPSGTTVRINGSTSMAQINKALKDNFEGSYPNTSIEIDAKGTDQGIKMLLNGQIDIAAISRPLTDAEKAQGLMAVPITEDAIAIVVGNDNPFRRGLTEDEVEDIFEGDITDWSQVGGVGGTIRVINRPPISGTHQSFKEIVLDGDQFGTTPNIITMQRDATTPILRALGTDGISYATAPQVVNQQTVRTVAIDGITPAASNYPFKRTLYYVYKDPPSQKVQAFLGYATAPIGRQIITSTNQ